MVVETVQVVIILVLAISLGLLLFSRSFVKIGLGFLLTLVCISLFYGLMSAYWLVAAQLLVFFGGMAILIFFIMVVLRFDPVSREKKQLEALVPMMGSKFTYGIAFVMVVIIAPVLYEVQSKVVSFRSFSVLPSIISNQEFVSYLLHTHILTIAGVVVLIISTMVGVALVVRENVRGDLT